MSMDNKYLLTRILAFVKVKDTGLIFAFFTELEPEAQPSKDSKEQVELVTIRGTGAILRVKSSDVNEIKDIEQVIKTPEKDYKIKS